MPVWEEVGLAVWELVNVCRGVHGAEGNGSRVYHVLAWGRFGRAAGKRGNWLGRGAAARVRQPPRGSDLLTLVYCLSAGPPPATSGPLTCVAELLPLGVAVSEEEELDVWEPLGVSERDAVLVMLALALADADCTPGRSGQGSQMHNEEF